MLFLRGGYSSLESDDASSEVLAIVLKVWFAGDCLQGFGGGFVRESL